jgi:hypothetical protein
MILTHTKDLCEKNGLNSPDFQKQIAMFLQQVPVGSPNIKELFFLKKIIFFPKPNLAKTSCGKSPNCLHTKLRGKKKHDDKLRFYFIFGGEILSDKIKGKL